MASDLVKLILYPENKLNRVLILIRGGIDDKGENKNNKTSTVINPVTSLLSLSYPFEWNDACQNAFDNVKALLCNAPVLIAPDCAKSFTLEIDASLVGVGAVLIQEDARGIEHPVCFFSHKFNKHQLDYSTIEKETLALLMALQYFDVYISSSNMPVTMFTVSSIG